MKQWGLTPNRDTVKLHQELSSTSCPRRSVEVHGGTLESCRSYFITELNKRLTGQTESKQNEKEIEMYLIYCTDTKRYYVSNGVSVRYVRSTRMLENYQNKWGKSPSDWHTSQLA